MEYAEGKAHKAYRQKIFEEGTTTMKRARLITFATLAALALCGPLGAAAQTPGNQWTFSITPYLWLPNIDGTLKYNIPPGATGSPEAEVGPNDYLENLRFAMMISGEARKNRWLVFTDFIYLDFSSEDSSVKSINFGGNRVSSSANVSTDSSLKGGAWTLGGGYAVLPGRPVELDVFGGLRYFGLKASTDWQLTAAVTGPGGGQTFPRAGSISEGEDLWDGIVGVKGRVWLGRSNWSIPYYFDVGTGSSSLTWQGMLGVAYSWEWIGVTLAYRHLYYDQKDDKLIQDMRFSGPALGVTFRF
jgi:hypothetical protein